MKFRFSIVAQIAVPIEDPKQWPADAEVPGHFIRGKGLQNQWIEIEGIEEADRMWEILMQEARWVHKRLEGRLSPEVIVPMCDKKD